MSGFERTLSDDDLDRLIGDYLAWRSGRLDGAPVATVVAERLAIPRHRTRPGRSAVLLVAAALAIGGVVGMLAMGARPPAPDDVPERIIVATSIGWTSIDPSSGTRTSIEPCDGACDGAVFPMATADGRTVFVVRTTPIGADLRPEAPGWSIWRWDRVGGAVTKLAVCSTGCSIHGMSPSPDGRHVAFIEDEPSASGPPHGQTVVVDALSGRELIRFGDESLRVPTWDAQGRLLLTTMKDDGSGPGRRERVDLTTSAVEEVAQDLPAGFLIPSPDGRKIMLVVGTPPTAELYLVDQGLTTATLFAPVDGTAWFGALAWSPDGTRIATSVMVPDWDTGTPELRSYALDGGAVSVLSYAPFDGFLTWLPALTER